MRAFRGLGRAHRVLFGEGGWRPRRWTAPFMMLLGVSIAVQLYDSRGPLVAVLALFVYSGVMGVGVLRWDQMLVWSAAHPRLDGLFLLPMTFVGLAFLTRLGLGWCAVAAIGLWLVVAPVGAWNRRRLAEAPRRRES